jgi:CRP/FNR family transcriptional regulator
MADILTETTSTLKSCAFLCNVGDDMLRKLGSIAKVESYSKDELIFAEGNVCDGMYIVQSGAVKIYKIGPDGREHVLHVAGPGDCFGEAALFLGMGYPAYAGAVKSTKVVLIRKAPFMKILEDDPGLCFKLLGSMAVWAHRLVTKLEILTLKDASARLAQYLLAHMPKSSEHKNQQTEIDLSIPKQTLAAHLAMSSETLSRLLTRFEAQGLIESQGRHVTILDPAGLNELAELGRAMD